MIESNDGVLVFIVVVVVFIDEEYVREDYAVIVRVSDLGLEMAAVAVAVPVAEADVGCKEEGG